jgi:hypothetical protein
MDALINLCSCKDGRKDMPVRAFALYDSSCRKNTVGSGIAEHAGHGCGLGGGSDECQREQP